MITNDIPLEGVLKYIKKERDDYKSKVEKLIPYAKSLEKRVKELEERVAEVTHDNEFLKNELEENKVLKAEVSEAKSILMENISLRAEVKALKEDYKKSEWFHQMEEQRKNLKEKYQKLTIAFNNLLSKHE